MKPKIEDDTDDWADYDWDVSDEVVYHIDANGEPHCVDGAAMAINGIDLWCWHGERFDPDEFDEDWDDDRKTWWMRAKMEGEG